MPFPEDFNPADASLWDGAVPDTLDEWRMIPCNWNAMFGAEDVLKNLYGPECQKADPANLPAPFRLRVQWALSLALRQISPVNGFYTDLSRKGQVARGRLVVSPTDLHSKAFEGMGYDDLPFVTILEEPFSLEADIGPRSGHASTEPYELILQGLIKDEPSEHSKTDRAHFLLADVKSRLTALKFDEDHGRKVFRLGNPPANSVVSVGMDPGTVRPADDVSPLAHFWLRIRLDVVEDYMCPWS